MATKGAWWRASIWGWVFIVMVGCSDGEIKGSEQTTTLSVLPTYTMAVTKSPTKTPVPSVTSRPFPTASLTPLATYPPEEALAKVLELLETNAECQLPCWWGIVPGETRANDAYNFLSSITNAIFGDTTDSSTYDSFYVQISLTIEYSPGDFIFQNFSYSDGLIEGIHVGFLENDRHSFRQLLNDFGQPDQIWVDALNSRNQTEGFEFVIILFYSNEGIIALSHYESEISGGNFIVCPPSNKFTRLGLWMKGDPLSFHSAVKRTGILDLTGTYKQLQGTTDISVEDFYKNYREEGSKNCFTSPGSTWDYYPKNTPTS